MKRECRRFLEPGMLAAADLLTDLRTGAEKGVPQAFLTDPSFSVPIGGNLAIPKQGFPTRWHLGAWLYRELDNGLDDDRYLRDPGLWTWLAFRLFDILRPVGTKVYENARYILAADDYRKRYRHLVSGPFLVFSLYEDEPQVIRALLATPPQSPGDLYEQFASRQELITSAAVVGAINRMYFDAGSGALKRGAGANARRLAEVLMQFDVTYDFAGLSAQRLLEMLPREFRRFLPNS